MSLALPTWTPDPQLENAYAGMVTAIRHQPPAADYSIILHGSVLWGDRSNLRNGLPVSDVDVLVIGENVSDLTAAACALRSIADQHKIQALPFFKLSVKLRTRHEIATENLSANELGALLHGAVLVGDNKFDVLKPTDEWFRRQADLAIATRLAYVTEQETQIAAGPYEAALRRYLSCRLMLDITTVGLLLRRRVGQSYSLRVATFIAECSTILPADFQLRLRAYLATALQIKRAPEVSEFVSTGEATQLLLEYGRCSGLRVPVSLDASEFWREARPLDCRDRLHWNLRKPASS